MMRQFRETHPTFYTEVQAEAESMRREAAIAGPNGAQATLPA
jgi:hypothetical protein